MHHHLSTVSCLTRGALTSCARVPYPCRSARVSLLADAFHSTLLPDDEDAGERMPYGLEAMGCRYVLATPPRLVPY